MNYRAQKYILFVILLGSLVLILTYGPINQDQNYHNFADQRSVLGMPNFFDVMTNIFFALIGMAGLYFITKNRQADAPWAWLLFFIGTISVSLTSGYYHWQPTDDTLVWDRLSLAVIFMSLVTALLSEIVNSKFDRFLLGPLILAGILSVIYWYVFDDLRFYVWAQLAPMILIPVLLIFYQGKYSHKRYLLFTLVFYSLAKVVEIYDEEIFRLNNGNLSGHSLKHIFAAIGLYFILQMLQKRKMQLVNDSM